MTLCLSADRTADEKNCADAKSVCDALGVPHRSVDARKEFEQTVIDYFTREGYSVGEIMATMTVLEIKGLTVTLPGGLYSRK